MEKARRGRKAGAGAAPGRKRQRKKKKSDDASDDDASVDGDVTFQRAADVDYGGYQANGSVRKTRSWALFRPSLSEEMDTFSSIAFVVSSSDLISRLSLAKRIRRQGNRHYIDRTTRASVEDGGKP